MTREEATSILYNQWQGFLEDNIDYAGVSDAYKMAIKALEQQSVLDKIRAEIEQEPYVSKMEVLEIIDKYKAESEVEERKKTDDSIKVEDEVISEYNVKSVVFKNDDFDNLDSMLEDLWNAE